MPWSAPKTWVAGAVLPASDLNTHLRDQLLVLRGGGIAIPGQTALDFIFAEDTDQFGRLAPVAGKFPRLNLAGTDWEMAYPGAGVHELLVPIAAFRSKTSGGPGGLEDILLSSGRYITAVPFDGTTLEGMTWHFALPKSWNKGTVTFQPYWFNTAGGSGAVVWSFAGVAVSDGDTLDVAIGTPQTSTDTVQGAKVLCIGPESAAITISGSPANGDGIRFELERTPAAGGDTYTGVDAYIWAIKLRFTTDAADDA